MAKSKADAFVPTQAFIVKKEQHLRKLNTSLQQEFVREIQALKSDSFSDIDLFIEEEGLHVYHKCILYAVAPTLYSSLNLMENGNEQQSIHIVACPENITNLELKALRMIYGSVDDTASEGLEISFVSLLKTDFHTDVTLKLGEEVFQCHRCILSMRSEFFRMMFSGNWAESVNHVVDLECISPKVFHIVLDILYKDKVELVLKSGDLKELLLISEMYQIDCLKKVLLYHIKSDFCHFFHMPCQHCISGVLITLELCSNYVEYQSIIAESHKWFLKYYAKIFLNKKFVKATQALKEDLSKEIKHSVSLENVLQHLQDCIQVKARLPQVKTVNTVKTVVADIEKFCLKFAFDNFMDIVKLPAFLYSCYDTKNVNKNLLLQEFLIEGMELGLNTENCIGVYQAGLVIEKTTEMRKKSDGENEAIENCEKFYQDVKNTAKKFIQTNYAKVKRTDVWKNMQSHVRKEIMKGSGFLSLSGKS